MLFVPNTSRSSSHFGKYFILLYCVLGCLDKLLLDSISFLLLDWWQWTLSGLYRELDLWIGHKMAHFQKKYLILKISYDSYGMNYDKNYNAATIARIQILIIEDFHKYWSKIFLVISNFVNVTKMLRHWKRPSLPNPDWFQFSSPCFFQASVHSVFKSSSL